MLKKERLAKLHDLVAEWLMENCEHDPESSTPEGRLYDAYAASIRNDADATVPSREEFSIACIDAFLKRDILMCDGDVDVELYDTDLVNRRWMNVLYMSWKNAANEFKEDK